MIERRGECGNRLCQICDESKLVTQYPITNNQQPNNEKPKKTTPFQTFDKYQCLQFEHFVITFVLVFNLIYVNM